VAATDRQDAAARAGSFAPTARRRRRIEEAMRDGLISSQAAPRMIGNCRPFPAAGAAA